MLAPYATAMADVGAAGVGEAVVIPDVRALIAVMRGEGAGLLEVWGRNWQIDLRLADFEDVLPSLPPNLQFRPL